ncbi:NAD-dependent epimerase/dehydratase family protein [Pseudomonas sp. CIP-10]|uniref:NAD-dependent epimerase/dehydratase family protein n=1 Tax=Pseudomonas sp. CIP-10 TaxID=2892442 RepID=UPI001E612C4D|nr:NAD(P)-dependent oxidoreductase [Pseudomonas sp. CIP-10]UFH30037.1 NAD(P)-dependent oxidoreductase [Pseudomonas sp. CIP-10]
MSSSIAIKRVMVTGAFGNLGQKIMSGLAEQPWCERIIAVDRNINMSDIPEALKSKIVAVKQDLTEASLDWWTDELAADVVIHLAAANPLPDSDWEDCVSSYAMTTRLLEGSALRKVRRFIFASSNHAMGGYKDSPLADSLAPGGLDSAKPAAPGTNWFDGREVIYSRAYGTSKTLGERACSMVARLTRGEMTCISIRVGWALPGDNDPQDISYSGSPASTISIDTLSAEDKRSLRWFQKMWLSNKDLKNLFVLASTSSAEHWPSPAVIINGVSGNDGMVWNLEEAQRFIGYIPADNAADAIDLTT